MQAFEAIFEGKCA